MKVKLKRNNLTWGAGNAWSSSVLTWGSWSSGSTWGTWTAGFAG